MNRQLQQSSSRSADQPLSLSQSIAELDYTPELIAELRVGLLWFEQSVAQNYSYGRLERGGLCFTFQCWYFEADGSLVPPFPGAPRLHALVAPFESPTLAASDFSISAAAASAAASSRGVRVRSDTGLSSGSEAGAPSGYRRSASRTREQEVNRIELLTVHLSALPRERIHKQMTELFDLIFRDYYVVRDYLL